MGRQDLTRERLAAVMAHVPEGFIALKHFHQQFLVNKESLAELVVDSPFAVDQGFFYDTTRITVEMVRTRPAWLTPGLPIINKKGQFQKSSLEELQERHGQFSDPLFQAIIDHLAAHYGCCFRKEIESSETLNDMLRLGIVRHMDDIVYDPQRIRMNRGIVHTIMSLKQRQQQQEQERRHLENLLPHVRQTIANAPDQVMQKNQLAARFDASNIDKLIAQHDLCEFITPSPAPPRTVAWVCVDAADLPRAQAGATKILHETEGGWKPLLAACGVVLRPEAREGKTARMRVIGRTYRAEVAARQMGVPQKILQMAISRKIVAVIVDPEGRTRIPANVVERIMNEPEEMERITAFIALKVRSVALVAEVHYSTAWRRLQKMGLKSTRITWGDVRGKWNLPTTFHAFQEILQEKRTEWRTAQNRAQATRWQQIAATGMVFPEIELGMTSKERRQARALIRERLVAAFPTWQHALRQTQQVILHVGPTNSGKTHEALRTLVSAGSGWYLAPLRLLAYEIFERLNREGVPCSLLTGEEQIPIQGAQITAATIEMFQPSRRGQCVVIDEAHMLGDPDRGWAWTRALMESQSPTTIVVSSPVAQPLVEQLAAAATLPLTIIAHQRLVPLAVASRPWSLAEMPPQTILVAFSRQWVLGLKSELERMGRTVSVIYGNLPPEVRHHQAQRFASRATEICVATDAVGMGLNLPAEHVCFFELTKFDGRRVRTLTPVEVHQIGGRAGRYGLSEAGLIGATNMPDLSLLRQLYASDLLPIAQARVAPSVADLELIPGNLATKMSQWATLESIPETLKPIITTSDLSERIALASCLHVHDVEQLGLAAAVKLCNAPTRRDTRSYWQACANAILRQQPLPLPPTPPTTIETNPQLHATESSINCADIYLWLAHTPEFCPCTPEHATVRAARLEWSERIDATLTARVNVAPRCRLCGHLLPFGSRYAMCQACYNARQQHWYAGE